MVTCDNITFLIHAQAAICIAIVSKTNIQAFFYNEFLQTFDMSGACIVVDVQTIGLVVDNIGVCTESILLSSLKFDFTIVRIYIQDFLLLLLCSH